MRRAGLSGLAVALAVAAGLGTGAPPGGVEPAAASHGKNCGIVTKGARDYRVLGKRMRCQRARKGARLYLRQGRALRGFSCAAPAGQYEFICGRGAKTYRAKRL